MEEGGEVVDAAVDDEPAVALARMGGHVLQEEMLHHQYFIFL